ncbi:Methyltransferase [Acidisarcina polymorpha]|uniref:Methyltransferase n=2 Tax=Acidisarcina polymorpha TaxID=2211140 RepID=A0A2Z5FUW8_9BACT|nr:Methyltransferase [Acidisarcina polymorpha]
METGSAAAAFWEQIYANTTYSRELNDRISHALNSAHAFFKSTSGFKVLDVGCGPGATAIYWANTGADVTAIDHCASAIAALETRCEQMGIKNIHPLVGDVMKIDQLGQFDYIFGSMILHHLEPFQEFAAVLRRTLSARGKAFFYENNAASDLLIWFRTQVTGKFGVPKYGDKDEFPLSPKEINMLREQFSVGIEYPEMMFFQLASSYLFHRHLATEMKTIDNFLYKRKIGLRYSYRQYVELDALPEAQQLAT